MDQKWMQILVILVFFQKITTGACEERVIKEKEAVEIVCNTQDFGSTFVWLRVLDITAMEFIASFNLIGDMKAAHPSFSSIFSNRKSKLILNSFNKARDSGVYGCVSQKGQVLKIGTVTRLVGEKVKVSTEAPLNTTKPSPCTTAAPCVCDHKTRKEETNPLMLCSPIILGPLVGSCGLLLLLLIITTLYCNKIRTRRCPHHYKRKPRAMPPGNQMKTSRQI
ncbi:T-cell surface glycoprotein CD8 alpha chain [Labrus mixtus]|uniref:T-cell surface glycoprotein CD8 alpha chain n=1 Tax=Labrus mixtus TaxID=508554 RepID=UPI0029C04319|nr:T-cell surface glycoprotein CD8 alpha chain [Labrus mixtus]